MPLLKKPPREEEEDGDPFAANPESRYRRRATLERLVGLAPFGRARRVPPKDSDGDGSHARRRSEDFGLLRRLPGRRKASVEALAERTVPKRSSLLRLALGTRGRRGSAGERSPTAESDGVSDGDQDSGGQRQEGRGRAREPLSVLEILELIQRRELVAADEQIIALEAECAATSPASPSVSPVPAAGRQARDVALLYEALLAQLWAVLGEAVPVGRPYPPLRLVIRVLEQEEAADRQHPPGTPGRPRALRRRWQEAVGRAAGERLAQVAPAAGLGARLAALAARLVGDLGAVRCHVAPAYPPEYGAFGIYARGYHRALAQQLGALAQRPLAVPDLYLLLDWHSNTYPREVLGHPEVGALLQAQALGPLLPPETQRSLESSCIAAVKAKVEVAVAQELQLSEDTWAEEATGQELQEGLATRVTGLLRAHVERAPQITPEFGREMAHSLLGVLVAFLHSFQRKVERFLEAPGEATPPDGATSRAIALVNCCPPFRTFTERLAQFGHPESEEPRRQAHAALDKVTRLCNHVLTQRLFEDLKPYFNKLMKRKWLTSSDAFDTIVMLITSFSQKLRLLRPEPYQVLVSEVHRRVLIEYVRPLLQGRLVCTSAKMRARVAARLSDEARQLRELFSRLVRAPTHPPQHPWVLLRLGGGDGAEVLAGFGLALAGFGGAAAAGAAGAGGHGGAADGGGRPGEGLPRRPAEARGGGAGREGVAGPNDAPGDPGGGAGPGAERGRAGAAAPMRFFLRAGDDARGALPALPPAPPRPPPPAPPAPPAPRAGPALSSRTHPWVPHRTLVLGAAPRAPSPSSLKLCINGVN